ncbi:MAG: hypothetical protein ACM3MI_03480 [Clostridiales bacterium]
MNDFSGKIVKRDSYAVQIQNFEGGIISILQKLNLPSENIFVNIPQRLTVFKNIDSVIEYISQESRVNSIYISKFIAAVASGLFDAALNYLWDETITELRKRIAQYDLSYFFDNAVQNPEKRKKLGSEEDLQKIDDSELILGAREIDLISEIGYKHLDYIRYMRNWISAAHPNQGQITGLQLISWLETCVKEVMSLPLSSVAVQIKRLLSNIRENVISIEEAKEIGSFFLELTQDQINNFVFGLFGIYTRLDSSNDSRNNIHKLLPLIWDRVDENTREGLGLRYAKYVANNDQKEKNLSREILDLVNGAQYIPGDLRVVEIETSLENLLIAHRGNDNFYNEPAFARQLERIVGEKPVPSHIRIKYVLGVVEAYLSNGNGVAWNAEPIYLELIDRFNQKESLIAIIAFRNQKVSSRLQFPLCQKQFLLLINRLRTNITSPAAIEIIDIIESYKFSLENMRRDTKFNKKVDNIVKIVKN